MRKLFITFLFFIISLNLIGCGPSEELTKKKSEQFWEMSSYNPKTYSKIVGVYERSSGFDGGYLRLYKDSTFIIKMWTDLYDPTNPYDGNSGKYSLNADTLSLDVESVTIDTSKFKKLFPDIKDEKVINKLIQDSLDVYKKGYSKSLISIKDTNKILYNRLKDLDRFNIKRIGEYILLVQLPFKKLFLDELLKDYYYPQCVSCKNRIFSSFFTKQNLNKQ